MSSFARARDTSPLIMLISGSTRRPSHTFTLTATVAAALRRRGARTLHWSVRDRALAQSPDEAGALEAEFVAAASAADALVLASPVYHGSYSGALKNALDHLRREDVAHKPVLLLAHGGERSLQPADHLRVVVRAVGGIALPSQVATLDGDYANAGDAYRLVAPCVLERIARSACELIVYAHEARRIRAALDPLDDDRGATNGHALHAAPAVLLGADA